MRTISYSFLNRLSGPTVLQQNHQLLPIAKSPHNLLIPINGNALVEAASRIEGQAEDQHRVALANRRDNRGIVGQVATPLGNKLVMVDW